jgi:ribose/xylose/arabinose/galactoside ABC-type transport system permease subunit
VRISNEETGMMNNQSAKALKRSEFAKKYGAIMVFAILLMVNIIVTPNFISSITIYNLIIHSTTVVCIAMGMTFVIAVAGIDISVGATMSLCATVTAIMAENEYPIVLCVFIGLLLGGGVGAFIGVMTVKYTIQPMVLTLAMMIILRSAARMVSNAKTVQIVDPNFLGISGTSFGEIPIQLIYILVFTISFFVLAEHTVFGKSVEAIGNNITAAKLSGIFSDRIVVFVYLLLGALSALAGIMAVSRMQNCNPSSVGSGIELEAIAAVVIGGTSMSGGKPRVMGTLVGCFIMSIITMMVNMNGIDTAWSMLLEAAIIIIAVYIQSGKGTSVKKVKYQKAYDKIAGGLIDEK